MPRRPRQSDHRRPLADPANVADSFASGFEVHDFDDWLRLVAWADITENSHTGRRKVASVVMPRSALQLLMQALRESGGDDREARRH
jgi:hypothetical protein